MGVKYLHRAQDGATATDPNGGGTDLGGLDLGAFSADPKFQDFLRKAQAYQILSNIMQPKNVPPVGDVLSEQRQRAQAGVQSFPEGSYLPGLEPGGLGDAINAFSREYGGGSIINIADDARHVQYAPLDSLGSSLDDAIAAANKIAANAANAPGQQLAGPLGSAGQGLLDELMGFLHPDASKTAAAAQDTGVTTNGYLDKGRSPGGSSPNPAGVRYTGSSPFDQFNLGTNPTEAEHAKFVSDMMDKLKQYQNISGYADYNPAKGAVRVAKAGAKGAKSALDSFIGGFSNIGAGR